MGLLGRGPGSILSTYKALLVPQLDFLTNLSFVPLVLGLFFVSYMFVAEYLNSLLVSMSESLLTTFNLSPHFLKLTTAKLFFFYWSLNQAASVANFKGILSTKI